LKDAEAIAALYAGGEPTSVVWEAQGHARGLEGLSYWSPERQRFAIHLMEGAPPTETLRVLLHEGRHISEGHCVKGPYVPHVDRGTGRLDVDQVITSVERQIATDAGWQVKESGVDRLAAEDLAHFLNGELP